MNMFSKDPSFSIKIFDGEFRASAADWVVHGQSGALQIVKAGFLRGRLAGVMTPLGRL